MSICGSMRQAQAALSITPSWEPKAQAPISWPQHRGTGIAAAIAGWLAGQHLTLHYGL